MRFLTNIIKILKRKQLEIPFPYSPLHWFLFYYRKEAFFESCYIILLLATLHSKNKTTTGVRSLVSSGYLMLMVYVLLDKFTQLYKTMEHCFENRYKYTTHGHKMYN